MRASEGREILNRVQSEDRDMSGIIRQVQRLKFDKHDENSKAAIKHFYDTEINIIRSQDERIMLMSSLNDMTEFACHVLGKLLSEEEESIKRRYSDWLKTGSNPETKPLYKTLNGFLSYYKNEIGISTAKAYYCKNLYERYSIDDIIDLGVKNVINISIIKDDDLLNSVVEYSKTNDLSSDEMQGLARAIKEVEKIEDPKLKKKMAQSILKAPEPDKIEKKLEEIEIILEGQNIDKKEEWERVNEEYPITVEILSNKQVVISVKNKEHRDYVNQYILNNIKAIKNYIFKMDTGRG